MQEGTFSQCSLPLLGSIWTRPYPNLRHVFYEQGTLDYN